MPPKNKNTQSQKLATAPKTLGQKRKNDNLAPETKTPAKRGRKKKVLILSNDDSGDNEIQEQETVPASAPKRGRKKKEPAVLNIDGDDNEIQEQETDPAPAPKRGRKKKEPSVLNIDGSDDEMQEPETNLASVQVNQRKRTTLNEKDHGDVEDYGDDGKDRSDNEDYHDNDEDYGDEDRGNNNQDHGNNKDGNREDEVDKIQGPTTGLVKPTNKRTVSSTSKLLELSDHDDLFEGNFLL